MTLAPKLKAAVAALIVLFAIGLGALVAFGQLSPAADQTGPLEKKLKSISANGMNTAAIKISDVYGEDTAGIIAACPGITAGSFKQMGIDLSSVSYPVNGPQRDESYFVILNGENYKPSLEKFDSNKVDLCTSGLSGTPIVDDGVLTFIHNPEQDTWILLAYSPL
ncbi:hypothetical protein EML15_05810 [Corynebacterium sp. sy017]|uniref:hypothetical protein n=1 Tax=unclassified Corynebacterium TaxID=2624378 RepID=UPI0011860B92|nr:MULTISPECIES: hypothetical protein [unclassified Corynebacterium]MBP3088663.1 hypothetical protein [Corynebacterium sp. sy017]TSD91954.1 hypothetical protein ELY17_05810 [Corynebacterium sp. SY003]